MEIGREVTSRPLAVGSRLLPAHPVDGIVLLSLDAPVVASSLAGQGARPGRYARRVVGHRGLISTDPEGPERHGLIGTVDHVACRNIHPAWADLVDLTIAVVVDLVAGLGDRLSRGGIAADATIGAHGGAGALTRANALVANRPHVRGVVVLLSIAVVVDPVAGFHGWLSRLGGADDLTVHTADLRAVLEAGTGADVACLAEAESFVGRAVAVVVQPVAELGVGLTGNGVASEQVAAALLRAVRHAFPLARGAGLACARDVVDVTVEVVIESVTDFRLWTWARLKYASHALLREGHTRQERAVAGDVGVVVDQAVAVVVLPITELGHRVANLAAIDLTTILALGFPSAGAVAHAAGGRIGLEVLVDLSVAVVVDPVAGGVDLVAGRADWRGVRRGGVRNRTIEGGRVGDAGIGRGVRCRVRSSVLGCDAHPVFIDVPIAVVVLPVANFERLHAHGRTIRRWHSPIRGRRTIDRHRSIYERRAVDGHCPVGRSRAVWHDRSVHRDRTIDQEGPIHQHRSIGGGQAISRGKCIGRTDVGRRADMPIRTASADIPVGGNLCVVRSVAGLRIFRVGVFGAHVAVSLVVTGAGGVFRARVRARGGIGGRTASIGRIAQCDAQGILLTFVAFRATCAQQCQRGNAEQGQDFHASLPPLPDWDFVSVVVSLAAIQRKYFFLFIATKNLFVFL